MLVGLCEQLGVKGGFLGIGDLDGGMRLGSVMRRGKEGRMASSDVYLNLFKATSPYKTVIMTIISPVYFLFYCSEEKEQE